MIKKKTYDELEKEYKELVNKKFDLLEQNSGLRVSLSCVNSDLVALQKVLYYTCEDEHFKQIANRMLIKMIRETRP